MRMLYCNFNKEFLDTLLPWNGTVQKAGKGYGFDVYGF